MALAGLTAQLGQCGLLGAYVGYQNTSGDLEHCNDLHAQGVRYGLLGSWDRGGLSLQGLLGGVYQSYKLQRAIRFSTIARLAMAKSSTQELDAALQASYGWRWGRQVTGPLVNAQYTGFSLADVSETGACSLDLCVDYPTVQSLLTNVGWQWGGLWAWGEQWSFAPQLYAAWQHQCLSQDPTIQAAFFACGPYEPFCTPTCDPSRDWAVVGGELSLTRGCIWTINLLFNALVGNADLRSLQVMGGVGYRF